MAELERTPSVELPDEAAGTWRCLNVQCSQGAFRSVTQSVAQTGGTQVACPACGGTNVIYEGDIITGEEVSA